MSLEKRVYSILIVSSAEQFNEAVSSLISESKYSPVHTASSISAAKRCLAERTYDYIVINSPLPDDVGVRFAIDTSNTEQTVVLLIVRNEIHGEIHAKVAEHGVFTLAKPVSKTTLNLAFSWMASARERLRKFEKKTLSVEEKMKEIRIVNQAKWLLISHLNMDEPTAHHYIEKQAMDGCLAKRAVAEEIIRTYSN